jgi:hypothetical protein
MCIAPRRNRIQSYHLLRALLAGLSGKKHLTGRTDLDVAISIECGRLIANVVIAYNSILLSMLLNRCQTGEKEKPLELLKKISPAAWQHISLPGPSPLSRQPPTSRFGGHLARAEFD